MKNLSFNQKGAILIEAILALTVIVVLMTALVSALVSSLSNSNYSKAQTAATGYAQEGLDYMRNERDNNYTNISTLNGTYCLSSALAFSGPGSPCGANIDGKFSRSLYVNNTGKDERSGASLPINKCESSSVFVASSVSWTDSKCTSGLCHKVELSACFTNLESIPGF
jgi:Tfp pilus assembly protein PilV